MDYMRPPYRPGPSMNPQGNSYEPDPNSLYGGGGGRSRPMGLGALAQHQGIAVGEPNPSAPGGFLSGYTGPMPGQDGFQHGMIRDWAMQQHPQWQHGAQFQQHRPQGFSGYQPGPDPRPMQGMGLSAIAGFRPR